jgi:RNA polymerase sigma-54 factor
MPAITLQLRSGQAITFSPQLQRAVRLLQMSSLEYTRALHDTAEANPFLELDDDEPVVSSAAPESFAPTSVDEHSEAAFSHLLSHDESFDLLQGIAIPGSLRAHLHHQIGVLRLSEGERLLADAIVESLDDDGYLRMSLEEIGGVIGVGDVDVDSDADGGSDGGIGHTGVLAALQTALWRVQTLDPPGVGARNVQECLTLQLPSIANLELRGIARHIVKDHIDLLASRNDRRLALEIGTPLTLVQAAVDCIRKLNPRPGWQHEETEPRFVTPDVTVNRVRGIWTTTLNRAALPRIRLHQDYATIFEKYQRERSKSDDDAEMGRCLEQARWTIQNVAQRGSTILDIARAIVARQRLFLEYGPLAMKPMGLREIADIVGVHASTVSRAAHHKYMATPWGTFEFGYFFSRGVEQQTGGSSASTAVKELIRQLIAAEAPTAPLSDSQLMELLAQQGCRIARRTVTKYRLALKIEPADRRRAPSAK